MEKQLLIYLLLFISFTAGSIYNFKKRKECNYKIKVKKLVTFILVTGTIILLVIAYIGGNTWDNYLLSLVASIFLTSGVISEGIHEKGIYYSYGKGVLLRLAKWEDIKNIKFELDKYKLKSLKIKTLTIIPNQFYNSEDIDKIQEYSKMKMKNEF